MQKFSADQICKRYGRAVEIKRPWISQWQDIYDLCLPGRRGFFNQSPGQSKTDDIFDDTGALSMQEFANVMVDGLAAGDIFKLVAGANIPVEEREEAQATLDDVNDFLHECLRKSNFEEQFFENMIDISIGTAAMNVEASGDARYVSWEAWPLESYCIDRGPFGRHDGSFRMRNDVRVSDIEVVWPQAKMPSELSRRAQEDPDNKPTFVEFTVRLWKEPQETYQKGIVWLEEKKFILDTTEIGVGSRGDIVYNWARASGEVWGRGPALLALPSMRTTNFTIELILENADMHVGGIWKAENDGITNYDNIRLVPGTVITYMPGQKGLEAVEPAGNFNVADIVLSDQRRNIREAFLNENFAGRGDTPISAAEVGERRAKIARKAGASVNRIFNEGIIPMVHRIVYLLRRQGILEIPAIDGNEIDIIPVSPLARSKRQENIQQTLGFVQSVTGIMGDSAQLWLSPEPILKDLAKMFEQPEAYLLSQEERDQITARMMEAQAMQQASPEPNVG